MCVSRCSLLAVVYFDGIANCCYFFISLSPALVGVWCALPILLSFFQHLPACLSACLFITSRRSYYLITYLLQYFFVVGVNSKRKGRLALFVMLKGKLIDCL